MISSNEDNSSLKTTESSKSISNNNLNNISPSALQCNENNIKEFELNEQSFLGDNLKPQINNIYKDNSQTDLLTLQIKYALSKISTQHCKSDPTFAESPLCKYYCNTLQNQNCVNNNDNNISLNNDFMPKDVNIERTNNNLINQINNFDKINSLKNNSMNKSLFNGLISNRNKNDNSHNFINFKNNNILNKNNIYNMGNINNFIFNFLTANTIYDKNNRINMKCQRIPTRKSNRTIANKFD